MTISTNNNNWVFCQNPNPQSVMRLFCFPYGGGGISAFNTWHKYFPENIEICAVQLPGRETRFKDPLFKRLLPLVKELVHIVRSYSDKPFAFFGHSMGLWISFELARQLRRESLPAPTHLFLSGSRAPHIPSTDPNPLHHSMPDKEFIDKLKELGGLPDELLQEPELIQLYLPILKADIEMLDSYVHIKEDPLEIPISAFGGLTDPKVSKDDIVGWGEYTHQNFSYHMLPGGHFFLHENRDELLLTISKILQCFINKVSR